jgi:hypothetical protein
MNKLRCDVPGRVHDVAIRVVNDVGRSYPLVQRRFYSLFISCNYSH